MSAQWQVERMFPERGTIGGGDTMTITTDYKSDDLCDPFACGTFPEVTFGDVPARSAINARGIVSVITPMHVRGTVPVTVDFGDDDARLVGSFTFVDDRDLFPIENYEPILFPVAVGGAPVAGANGSIWTSELWVSNHGHDRVELVEGLPSCAVVCTGQPFPAVEAGETRPLQVPADGVNAAYRVYAQRGGNDDLSFSLRVRDVSHAEDNHGTRSPWSASPSSGATSRSSTCRSIPDRAPRCGSTRAPIR